MPVPRNIELAVQSALVSGVFAEGYDFEDVCTRLLKRVHPVFTSIRSTKTTPYNWASRGRPDAYALLDDHKWIYFEYTRLAEKPRLVAYVTKLPKRAYYRGAPSWLAKLVLVSSLILTPGEKETLSRSLAEVLMCSVAINDLADLVSWFCDTAPELISLLLNIECSPKWFSPLSKAIDDITLTQAGFPTLADFNYDKLSVDAHQSKILVDHFTSHGGPFFLSGRWGVGKTVLALYVGVYLEKHAELTPFYIDLKDHIGTDKRKVCSTLIKHSLPSFTHPKVLFIIDNAHQIPFASYAVVQWAKSRGVNVLLISRIISEDMCDENEYFPRLFGKNDHAITSEGDSSPEDSQSGAEDEDGIVPPNQTSLELVPDIGTIRRIVATHLSTIQATGGLSDQDLIHLSERIGYNLTLLRLLLARWNPTLESLFAVPVEAVLETLGRRFGARDYPEIYMLAALSYLDCPCDVNVLLPNPDRRTQFLTDPRLSGLIGTRSNRAFGISAAEGCLLIQAGLRSKAAILCTDDGRLPDTFDAALNTLVTRYAKTRPLNPYELLKHIRWAAREAQIDYDARSEEQMVEIMSNVLSSPEFTSYLRFVVLPSGKSLLGLGNIARVFHDTGIKKAVWSSVLTGETIDLAMQAVRTGWVERRGGGGPLPFTSRGVFVWRQLAKLDPRLGSQFLSQFSYLLLLNYGLSSLRALSSLLWMASEVQWLGDRLTDDMRTVLQQLSCSLEETKSLSEVQVTFLIRNAHAFSEDTVLQIFRVMTPLVMASIIQSPRNKRGGLLYAVYRYAEHSYFRRLMALLPKDEVYRQIYARGIDRITWAGNEELFEIFLKNDLETSIVTANLGAIERFMRRLKLFGFSELQQDMAAKVMNRERIRRHIYSLFRSRMTRLADIGYFLLNAESLAPTLVDGYAQDCLEAIPVPAFYKAPMGDLALFLLAIWITTSINPLDRLGGINLEDHIEATSSRCSASELVQIVGTMAFVDPAFKVTVDAGRSAQGLERYLERIKHGLPDDAGNRGFNTTAYRLAVSIVGAQRLIGQQATMRETFMDTSAHGLLSSALVRVEALSKTAMSAALGEASVTVLRKKMLFEKALECLGPRK